MRRAIYPGTFDPITNGHLDIIGRALNLFDQILITVAINPSKTPLFSMEERIDLIQDALREKSINHNVEVKGFDGLLVKFASEHKACAIIRGLRAISDFEYEFQMALMNRRLGENITTVFMMPHEKYTYLNSTIVKEVARLGGDVAGFIPSLVKERLLKKFKI